MGEAGGYSYEELVLTILEDDLRNQKKIIR